MIDSGYVSWTLTVIFGTAGLLFTVARRPPTTPADRLSDGIHIAGSAAMIAMCWSWGSRLPAWPQVAAFALAAGWFLTRVVRARTRPEGPSWHDLHQAAMAGAFAWSIAAMPGPHSPGGTAMPHHHHTASSGPAAPADPGTAIAAVVFTMYFVVAAWPWLSTAVRALRRTQVPASHGRRIAAEAASHAVMSVGMAAMFVVMASFLTP